MAIDLDGLEEYIVISNTNLDCKTSIFIINANDTKNTGRVNNIWNSFKDPFDRPNGGFFIEGGTAYTSSKERQENGVLTIHRDRFGDVELYYEENNTFEWAEKKSEHIGELKGEFTVGVQSGFNIVDILEADVTVANILVAKGSAGSEGLDFEGLNRTELKLAIGALGIGLEGKAETFLNAARRTYLSGKISLLFYGYEDTIDGNYKYTNRKLFSGVDFSIGAKLIIGLEGSFKFGTETTYEFIKVNRADE
ncbi:hypothetical protein GCM10011506_32580 [Marivirga lumbricoides]|uniref:Uncharacterized protein n=2 Tax=Marivirga lumbricoides TaxID=1046115 RepID=A0ABQ1MPP7_9BACT|nr:hypothetical protein GCM10011506_32580 [Marivirga lumbricoides]